MIFFLFKLLHSSHHLTNSLQVTQIGPRMSVCE